MALISASQWVKRLLDVLEIVQLVTSNINFHGSNNVRMC
jgi:hypothetical protein